PHVAEHPFHTGIDTGLGDHQVEQVVSTIEGALRGDRRVEPVGVDEVAQRAFEVGRQLSGIVTRCSPTHAITFDQHDVGGRVAQGEERRRHAGDAVTNDNHISHTYAVHVTGHTCAI